MWLVPQVQETGSDASLANKYRGKVNLGVAI
jgi:hypothetical protein